MSSVFNWQRVSLGKHDYYYTLTDEAGNLWEIEPTYSDAWVIFCNSRLIATIEQPDAVRRAKVKVEGILRQGRRKVS